ncbi:MAG: hypothetical protein U0031_04800 [Thermomicrobiales bacterium]
MNNQNSSSGGRWQWGSYGFMAGLAVGVMAGWIFSGFVGALVRVGLVALVVVPLVLVFLAYRRYVVPIFQPKRSPSPLVNPNAIETRAVIHSQAREPLPR